MSEVQLSKQREEWIVKRLEEWGAWAFSGIDGSAEMNLIAKLMRQADKNAVTQQAREMCDDELGMLISSVIGYCVKNPCPQDYKYLEAKYVFGCSEYSIAKYEYHKSKEKSLRSWQRRVSESLRASEWVIGKFLDMAIQNHVHSFRLKKFAFNG